MIDRFLTALAGGDPAALAVLAALSLAALLVALMLAALSRAGRSARASERLAVELRRMTGDVHALGTGQTQLAGSLQTVSETTANAQMRMLQTVESRLAEVQRNMGERMAEQNLRQQRTISDMQAKLHETLHGQAKRTTTSLTQLQERLATIDKAQDNIQKLSGDVLTLQDILSNKQRRGMFGEIQLTDIVSKALPADSYALQHTLPNGSRADCLIHLPNPPGPIVIDAKFPFEAYESYAAADTREGQERALKALGQAVRKHIRDISEKYILEGDTADGALMFLPSEAVYAELHARLPHIVREGFAARVWIVSPTTCMATLNTMRAILKDARMREQAGAIRKELGLLNADVERLGERVGNLDRHFEQARKDVEQIRVSSEKAGKRAARLHNFDFEELAPEERAALPGA